MPKPDAISRVLPHLRRYARTLTGSQESGDRYVRQFLEIILADRELLAQEEDAKLLIFKLFHRICSGLTPGDSMISGALDADETDIAVLPPLERQILLLSSVEGFPPSKIADITSLTDEEVREKLLHAQLEMQRDAGSKILVVEDEAVIAMDIVVTIRSIGHTVVGVADNLVRAVEAARKHQPDLALVDVQLKDGDTGIEVERIMRQSGIPCIFVTGFPEALLTGKAGEPAFVLTKPFDPHALAATISQVLAKSARSRDSQTPIVPPPAARAKSAPRSSAARRKRAGVTEMQSSR